MTSDITIAPPNSSSAIGDSNQNWWALHVTNIAYGQFQVKVTGETVIRFLDFYKSLYCAVGVSSQFIAYQGTFTPPYDGAPVTGCILQDTQSGNFLSAGPGSTLVANSPDPTQAAVFNLNLTNSQSQPLSVAFDGGGFHPCGLSTSNGNLIVTSGGQHQQQLQASPLKLYCLVPGGTLSWWGQASGLRFDLMAGTGNTTVANAAFTQGATNCVFNSQGGDNLSDGPFTLTLQNFTFNGTTSGCDFSRSVLQNCTFTGAVTNCDFSRSVLQNCTFTGAITNCDFSGCTLINATFAKATLTGCKFTGATFEGINFAGAVLNGCIFDPVLKLAQGPTTTNNFSGMTVQASWFGKDWSYLNLAGATIQGLPQSFSTQESPINGQNSVFDRVAGLHGRTIQYANFQQSSFKGTNLSGCDLSFSNFSQAVLGGDAAGEGATLVYATLYQCVLTNAVLDYADCAFAVLWGDAVSLRGASINGTNFSNAFLAEVDFSAIPSFLAGSFAAACLVGASFRNVTFKNGQGAQVLMAGAALQGVDFTNAKLGMVTLTNAAIATKPGTLEIAASYVDENDVPPSYAYNATIITPAQTFATTVCDDGSQGPCSLTALTTPQTPSKSPMLKWPISDSLAAQRQSALAEIRSMLPA
ncbi:MAG TPA: pentapeptide repeat-containing protein [Azospirillaceae bacterium]|nr:pentapeptide repeat-containing protein [Azospirillaceae bacterium]